MNYFCFRKIFTSFREAMSKISLRFEEFKTLKGVSTLEELVSSPLIFSFHWDESGGRGWSASGYTAEAKESISIQGTYGKKEVEVLLSFYAEEAPDLPAGWASIATSTCGRAVDLRDLYVSRKISQLGLSLSWKYEADDGCVSFFADLDPRPALWAIWGYHGPDAEVVIAATLGIAMAELRYYRPSFRHVPEEEVVRLRAYALAYYNAMQTVATACIARLGIFAEGDSLTFKREADEIVAE